jgi:LysM repeat protein
MKLHQENRKKLNAIRKAMLLGLPITGMMLAGYAVKAADKETSKGNDPAKRNTPAKKTFSIDTMSLFERQFTTAGIFIPPPVKIEVEKYKVRAGDTWESLAKRHGTTLEIMLRINGIPAEKAWDIIASKKVPDNLKLVPGQEIYVPGKK